jgi:hypothetical protein
MKKILLRNGTEHPEPGVHAVMVSVCGLLDQKSIGSMLAAYELYRICEDPNHKIFSPIQKKDLDDLALLDHKGQPPEIVKDVVLSMLDWPRENPLKPTIFNPIEPIEEEVP